MDLAALVEFCCKMALPLSDQQLELFESFGEGLYARNRVMNLTRVPYEQCALRHFVDSLLVEEFVPPGSQVLDIGTGPGFPAWPLACARPDLKVTALDSSGKMLGHLSGHLLPNLEIRRGRAEEDVERERFDFVTGRAVAALSVQLEVSAPWCRIGGLVVPFRVPQDVTPSETSVSELGLVLRQSEHRELPESQGSRLFPVYEKVDRTPVRYPRPWGAIKKKPL